MLLQRLLNSFSYDYSLVKIGVKTIEISWKPCKAHELASWEHNFRSNRWISKFFSFPKTSHPNVSRDTKINLIQTREGLYQVNPSRWPLKGHFFFHYKYPQTPSSKKKKKKKGIGQILEHFLGRFSLFSSLNSLPNTLKKSLIPLFSQ